MNEPELQILDEGAKLLITVVDDGVAVDLSGATLKEVLLVSPSGAKTTTTASFQTDGSDGQVFIVVPTGLLNERGLWKLQVRMTISGWAGRTVVGYFMVNYNAAG